MNSGKMESNPGDFPGFGRLRAACSSGLKGSEILWPSGVGIFHRSDSSLLTSRVDSRPPVLCASFFMSCEVMEFAETGKSQKERPDLPVSLFMVLHTLWLECEKSTELRQIPPIAPASFGRAEVVGTKRLYQSRSPLGLGWRSNRRSHTLFPSMAHSFSDSHMGCIVWPQIVGSRKNPGMPSQCLMCLEVAISQQVHLWEGKTLPISLAKVPTLHRIAVARSLVFWWCYEAWRCYDCGNFPRTHLSGNLLSWPKLAKARSGLVPMFHQWEKKLAVSFGLYNSPRLLGVA